MSPSEPFRARRSPCREPVGARSPWSPANASPSASEPVGEENEDHGLGARALAGSRALRSLREPAGVPGSSGGSRTWKGYSTIIVHRRSTRGTADSYLLPTTKKCSIFCFALQQPPHLSKSLSVLPAAGSLPHISIASLAVCGHNFCRFYVC